MGPVVHIFGTDKAVPGDVALCGYVKKDGRNYTGPACPICLTNLEAR